MNLNEINFSFGGLHCLRDFGCIYAEKGGHTIAPQIDRNEYDIAGAPGTIVLPGDLPGSLTFDGTLYFLDDPPTQAAAQQRLRRMAAWLTNGRQRLVFDYEPLLYYMASVDGGLEWGFGSWIGGGLDVSFTAQPYAYATQETKASVTTTGTSAQLALTLNTGAPAPLDIAILNTGTAPINAATITAGDKKAKFSGMSLTQNNTLAIGMEPPIGAEIKSGNAASDGINALPYADQFNHLTAQNGQQTITVTLGYGSGTKGARITIKARGRY